MLVAMQIAQRVYFEAGVEMDKDKLECMTLRGKKCIEVFSKRALKASFLPIVSLPMVHGLCVAMQTELDKIFNIGPVKTEKYSNIALGVIATPFMAIPLLGAVPSEAYVRTVGKSYMKALIKLHEDTLASA